MPSTKMGGDAPLIVDAPRLPLTHPRLAEFTTIPAQGAVEPLTGLRKGAINQLILPSEKNNYRPPVKSISLRRAGCARGTRLIVLRGRFGPKGKEQYGLLDYLWMKADEGQSTSTGGGRQRSLGTKQTPKKRKTD